MEKTKKIFLALVLVGVFCFGIVQLLQAKRPQQPSGIPKVPIWQITQEGTDMSIEWVDHTPNPRFAIYDPVDDDPDDTSLHIVLDKETNLVWERHPTQLAPIHTHRIPNCSRTCYHAPSRLWLSWSRRV